MSENVIKCINGAKERLLNPKHKMNYLSYVTYFEKKHDLTVEDDFIIRNELTKYIDENIEIIFPVSFTINGK